MTKEEYKEYQRNYQREYYQKHKDDLKAKARSWTLANPDKCNEIRRRSWLKNKDKCKQRHKEWLSTIRGYLARKIYHFKKRKKTRLLEMTIDIDFLVNLWNAQSGKCAITDYPMRFPECNLFSVSVDRIDSSKGYTEDNVQLVCQGINFAKNKYSNQEIKDFWNFRRKDGEGIV